MVAEPVWEKQVVLFQIATQMDVIYCPVSPEVCLLPKLSLGFICIDFCFLMPLIRDAFFGWIAGVDPLKDLPWREKLTPLSSWLSMSI